MQTIKTTPTYKFDSWLVRLAPRVQATRMRRCDAPTSPGTRVDVYAHDTTAGPETRCLEYRAAADGGPDQILGEPRLGPRSIWQRIGSGHIESFDASTGLATIYHSGGEFRLRPCESPEAEPHTGQLKVAR